MLSVHLEQFGELLRWLYTHLQAAALFNEPTTASTQLTSSHVPCNTLVLSVCFVCSNVTIMSDPRGPRMLVDCSHVTDRVQIAPNVTITLFHLRLARCSIGYEKPVSCALVLWCVVLSVLVCMCVACCMQCALHVRRAARCLQLPTSPPTRRLPAFLPACRLEIHLSVCPCCPCCCSAQLSIFRFDQGSRLIVNDTFIQQPDNLCLPVQQQSGILLHKTRPATIPGQQQIAFGNPQAWCSPSSGTRTVATDIGNVNGSGGVGATSSARDNSSYSTLPPLPQEFANRWVRLAGCLGFAGGRVFGCEVALEWVRGGGS